MVSFPLHGQAYIRVLIVDGMEEKGCILFWVEKVKCVVYAVTIE